MRKISTIVNQILEEDDVARTVGARGLLNFTAYARSIKPEIEKRAMKTVQVGSIATAVSRYLSKAELLEIPEEKDINQISVQTNLEGITYERAEEISERIRTIYKKLDISNNTYITITQGINEINIIELVSTATEVTFIIEKENVPEALDQLQNNI
jgi:hypothetical protein